MKDIGVCRIIDGMMHGLIRIGKNEDWSRFAWRFRFEDYPYAYLLNVVNLHDLYWVPMDHNFGLLAQR